MKVTSRLVGVLLVLTVVFLGVTQIKAQCGSARCGINTAYGCWSDHDENCTTYYDGVPRCTSYVCTGRAECLIRDCPSSSYSCSCEGWSPGTCGAGICDTDERQFTRTCTPNACGTTTACGRDLTCLATPTPTPAPLPVPSNTSYTCLSPTQVRFSWSALAGASDYYVRLNRSPYTDWQNTTPGQDQASSTAGATSITFNIAANWDYQWDVQGRKPGEPWPYSGARGPFAVFRCNTPTPTPTRPPPTPTTAACVPPAVPSNLTPNGALACLSASGTRNQTLSWSFIPGVYRYLVRVDDLIDGALGSTTTCASPGIYDICATVNVPLTHSGPVTYTYRTQAGHNYQWWVHSVNITNGCTSALRSANMNVPLCPTPTLVPTVCPLPGAPTVINASTNACVTDSLPKSVTFSWPAVAGATEYYVRINNTSNDNASCPYGWICDGSDVILENYPSTSYTALVLPGRAYRIWVHAGNACGPNWPGYASLNYTLPICPTATTVPTPTPTLVPDPECKLYAVHDAGSYDSLFMKIDVLGPTPFPVTPLNPLPQLGLDVEGLDIDPSTNIMYGTTGGGGGAGARLYQIDKVTGAATMVGPIINSATGLQISNLEGLSFRPVYNELWASGGMGAGLWRIDKNTAVATQVLAPTAPNPGTGWNGLAWNSSGTILYLANNTALRRFDPNTNIVTLINANILPTQTGALEMPVDGFLLLANGNVGGGGFPSTVDIQLLDVRDETNLQYRGRETITTNYYDIESITWPNHLTGCEYQIPLPTPTPTLVPNYSISGNVYLRNGTSNSCDFVSGEDTLVTPSLPDGTTLTFEETTTGNTDDTDALGSYQINNIPADSSGVRIVKVNNLPVNYSLVCYNATQAQSVPNPNTVPSTSTLTYFTDNVGGVDWIIKADPLAWWQTVGGDVGANGASGAITDILPSSGDFVSAATGAMQDGILTHSGITPNWGTAGAKFSNRDYIPASPMSAPFEDYTFFKALFTQTTNWPGTLPVSGDYYYETPASSSIAGFTVGAGLRVILLVEGELTITSDIVVNPGGFLAIIVKGDLIVESAVKRLQGIYIADNDIIIQQDPMAIRNLAQQFIGEGSFIGWDYDGGGGSETVRGIGLFRDLGLDNATQPGERFTYRPDLLLNAPALFRQSSYEWQEIAPR